ncbi:MAG: aspartate-semialdehyde dehydrogenase [SAR202 cluster bacterium]|jgi:aspartate-semialdehyde dehydrogenase|nr:aspartate-semialdehyde dehydrogenase [SAR202 cluster bacterium]|tara:strand:- start:1727 stop:2761 length:1035 start_codon:yes stop_codon:yes gene_type:complete
MSGANIAVVGATGAVGQVVLSILEQRNFPVGELRLLASKRSAGTRISVMGEELVVDEAMPDSFDGMDIVFFAAGGSTSQALAPEAAKRGAVVVDKSSAWRMDPTVPLVIPEINPDDIREHKGIISSPNCSTIVMLMALAPLHRANPIQRVIVDTYQSASGAGAQAVVELMQQTRDVLDHKVPSHSTFPATLAFNALPHVEDFGEDDYTTEEIKMENETRKIMHLPDLPVSATCVRVPVPISHSEAVHIEFANYMSPDEARDVLSEFPGVRVIDDIASKSYPLADYATGKDEIFVGRIRPDKAFHNGLSIWTVGDNLRKGAALNSVQIAEALLEQGLVSSNGNGR